MGNTSPEDVLGVAQGLANTEEVTLQVDDGNPASAAGASQSTSTSVSDGAGDGDQGGSPGEIDEVDVTAIEAALEDDDENLTDEEVIADCIENGDMTSEIDALTEAIMTSWLEHEEFGVE